MLEEVFNLKWIVRQEYYLLHSIVTQSTERRFQWNTYLKWQTFVISIHFVQQLADSTMSQLILT
jgi:hypothetical protein